MLQLIYELRKNCCGRVDGDSKVLQEVLADLKKIFENKDKQSLHVQKKVFVPTNSVDRIVEHKLRALQYNHDFT